MQIFALVSIAFAIGSVTFALQNNVPVTVTFLVWRFDSSLAMVLLLALGLGGMVVALLSTPATLKRQWTMSRQERRIAELERQFSDRETELAALRSTKPAILVRSVADVTGQAATVSD